MSLVQGLAKNQALLTLSSRRLIVVFAFEQSSVEHPETFSLEGETISFRPQAQVSARKTVSRLTLHRPSLSLRLQNSERFARRWRSCSSNNSRANVLSFLCIALGASHRMSS